MNAQVYRILIRATPEQIWDAITRPEFTVRYFHGTRVSVSGERLVSVGRDGSVIMDVAVEQCEPPHRLVHGWSSGYDPDLAAEPVSRVTWEISDASQGVCLLTVTHDRLDASPDTAAHVSGAGWMGVLSGMKTLLETGEPLFPPAA